MLPKRAFLCRKETKEIFSTIVHAAVLHNHVPDPAFCAVFQPLGGSHIRCVVVACFSETVSNWTVIQFSNLGLPHDITEKQKKDYDMIRPITGDVLRGRSNRNPSNILNGFCFSKCQDAV